ncbi:hypothetical protein HK104_000435 [Borealophlyctis nickersoniae]|nr:hypothetical protein HK104_000435 [Borealophlyctis nickersoniae]
MGVPAELCRFPDRTTPTGKLIDEYLKGGAGQTLTPQAAHLLFSANRWEAIPHLKHTLESGTTLIVDRYAYSGVAYSVGAQRLPLDWCKHPDVGLLIPDAVVYLDVPVDVAAGRGGFGGERYEQVEVQKRVREVFMELRDGRWKCLDGTKSLEDLGVEVMDIAKKVLAECAQQSLRDELWL